MDAVLVIIGAVLFVLGMAGLGYAVWRAVRRR